MIMEQAVARFLYMCVLVGNSFVPKPPKQVIVIHISVT